MAHQKDNLISIVIPAYNEQEVLYEFHQRLSTVLERVNFESETIYVNDGSSDDTLAIITSFNKKDNRVALVDLSRYLGKKIALTAGLYKAQGDAVGTPMIGLYATTNPDRARPYSWPQYVVNKYPEAVKTKYHKAVNELPWGTRVRDEGTMAGISENEVKLIFNQLITDQNISQK